MSRTAYRRWIQDQLSQTLTYPPLARRRGWETELTVDLTVDANGRLTAFEFNDKEVREAFIESARRALENIRGADPYCCVNHELELDLTIEFKLN